MKRIIIIISILFFITGCYNQEELNDLAIISAIDISKSKKNYNITLQIINSSKKDTNKSINNTEFIIYEGTGKSINGAVENISNKIPQKLYESQIQILTIDENIAKNNIKEVLDFFIRNNNTQNEFYVLISKREKNNLSIINKFYSKDIINTLKISNKYSGISPLITLNDLIEKYQNKNTEIILPIAESNKENDKEINIKSSAIFKNNKLINTLNKNDTIIYNLITNKINNNLNTTKCNNNKYIINQLIKPKAKWKLNKKTKKIEITITGTALIRENNCNLKLNSKDNIPKIEKKLNSNIKKLTKHSINKIIKTYNSDIYGFKDYIYRHHPKYYEKNIRNKTNYLKSIKISIDSKIKIISDKNLLGELKNE